MDHQVADIILAAFLHGVALAAEKLLTFVGGVFVNQPWVAVGLGVGYVLARISHDRRWRLV